MISFNQTCTYLLPADKVSFQPHKPPPPLGHLHCIIDTSFLTGPCPQPTDKPKLSPTQTKLKSQAVMDASSPYCHFSFSASLLIRRPKGSRLLHCSCSHLLSTFLSPAPHSLIPPLELAAQFLSPTPEETGQSFSCSTWDP